MTVCNCEIRIPFHDTDQAGVVHFSNFFRYFGIGMNDFLRKKTPDILESIKTGSVGLPAVEAHCFFKFPARFEDIIVINTWIERVGEKTVTFAHEIKNKLKDKQIANGYTVRVVVNSDWKSINIPKRFVDLIKKNR